MFMKFVEKYTAWWSEQNGSNVPLSVQERESDTNIRSINVDEYGVTLVGLSIICLRQNIFIMPRISWLVLAINTYPGYNLPVKSNYCILG